MRHFALLQQFSHPVTGRLERSVSAPHWPIPKRIVLDGDRLRWTWTPGKGWPSITPGHLAKSGPGLLEQFLRLRDAPAGEIHRYALRWGVLGLCEHDFPAQHPPDYWPSRPIEAHACPYRYADPYGFGPARASNTRSRQARRGSERASYRRADFHYCVVRGVVEDGRFVGEPWEPVEVWRTWARRAYALLAIAAALQQNRVGAAVDWQLASDTKMRAPQTPTNGWDILTELADYWLKAADVRPRPQFQAGQIRLTLSSASGASSLFGAIALQLVLAISGAPGFSICDGCRNVFEPLRSPREGEHHYCQDCRKRKLPQRHASARYRERRRGKPASSRIQG
jgi:hypothetical protein